MAHCLGLSVVAEGVETAEQHELRRSPRCSELQGFPLPKPMAADTFGTLLGGSAHWKALVAAAA
jgi:EAL domain-containing protein (putative c-di-GMP-specific phosphodiesterase class I)